MFHISIFDKACLVLSSIVLVIKRTMWDILSNINKKALLIKEGWQSVTITRCLATLQEPLPRSRHVTELACN